MAAVWGSWDARYGWRYTTKYPAVAFYGRLGRGEMGHGDELGVGCFYFHLGGFAFLLSFDPTICLWRGKQETNHWSSLSYPDLPHGRRASFLSHLSARFPCLGWGPRFLSYNTTKPTTRLSTARETHTQHPSPQSRRFSV